jgi:U4/U6.U5 tri-snRNP-associated protein 2
MINRKLLDFDFEKICSVTLSPLNCYACLTCGKYFQGRTEGTPAYQHALHHEHLIYLNLKTLKAYNLPDNLEYNDEGQFDDIRAVIRPKFNKEILKEIDEIRTPLADIQGRQFLPGFIGLNQIKANDYVNVILQSFAHVRPLRDDFLLNFSGKQGGLSEAFKEVLEKIWNPTRFKGQTSPHEFLQAIGTASSKRFSLVKQSDPLDFMIFLLNTLGKECPIVNEVFQGRIRIDSCDISQAKGLSEGEMKVDIKPFYFLSLDLPSKPLFADPRNPTAIPQVNLTNLLEKFNGGNFTYKQTTASAYSIQKYPKYLILHVNRFIKNNFVIEHNPTIVQFSPNSLTLPSQGMEMVDVDSPSPTYNLIANIYCSFPNDEDKNEKSFGVQLKCPATDSWLEIENLMVRETQAQMLFMSESYIQIWESA